MTDEEEKGDIWSIPQTFLIRFIRLEKTVEDFEKNFEKEKSFWKERTAYLAIICSLIVALILMKVGV